MPSVHRQRAVSGFNMVEIVLALAVVAVGVVSILGLFPVGMAASRDAMAIDYAANAADQFLHQLEYLIRRPATASVPTGWELYVLGSIDKTASLTWSSAWNKFTIPDDSGMSITAERADFDVPANGELLETVAGDSSSTAGNEAVFRYASGSSATRRYKVIRYLERSSPLDNDYDPAEDVLDFDAVMVVYRDQVSIPTGSGTSSVPYAMGAALNVDISWPAQLPEARREKRTYRLELFRR